MTWINTFLRHSLLFAQVSFSVECFVSASLSPCLLKGMNQFINFCESTRSYLLMACTSLTSSFSVCSVTFCSLISVWDETSENFACSVLYCNAVWSCIVCFHLVISDKLKAFGNFFYIFHPFLVESRSFHILAGISECISIWYVPLFL